MCHDYHKLYIIEYNPYKSRERLKKIIFDYTKLKMIPQRRTKNPCSTGFVARKAWRDRPGRFSTRDDAQASGTPMSPRFYPRSG